ncbi:uncharacterized protein BP01DRAFT_301792 [Aspergillus saccharolyticus JOP 1030-1]|uniref:DUF676 domain-containing protein n=1 Tax=Aspergillus saccharolyticus JOP 1030-1 TaxID=1450539 RepID=A0A318Z748_9EURO|nr:hypothetical protein BP01DRAFT_301792 [Aspergillus saccharolyticus JOP 1030-1]PYH43161.1 hypothetical protein BP01DRAFT_301792 [Aspergillus saccharolyticus JOP 1030-1]
MAVPNGERPLQAETAVDIVAVPAIGADPEKTWIDEGATTPWLRTDLKKIIQNARMIMIDHGRLGPQDDLESLADNLLTQLLLERQATSPRRPIFFICHSTGGLVAKTALVTASQKTSNVESIWSSCYGIAFLATPHFGSSYLSAPEFTNSVHHLMRLKHHIPPGLQEVFRPRHPVLLRLWSQFKSISADMKLWSFLETLDSEISIVDHETGTAVEMHVPITSIRSGILDFEHEKVIPLTANHMGTAYFNGQELTTRLSFISELQSSVSMALMLSKMNDAPMDVDQEVMIQVSGFFEDTARGVSDETPLKLWSTKASLKDYLASGPSICLRDRLQKTSGIPVGLLDDSSISSFDSRPTSAHVRSSIDGTANTPAARMAVRTRSEPIISRPPLRDSRSFLAPSSPRIHVTEPLGEGYFEVQHETVSDLQSSAEQAPQCPGADNADKNDTMSASKHLATSSSNRYKAFLPVPKPARDKQDEERAEKPRRIPRFDRPEPGSEKLLWIHVPYTHTGWVPPILARACREQDKKSFFEKLMDEEHWYSNLIRARHLEPHARYVRPACIHFKQEPHTNFGTQEEEHDPRLALYVPYLHWDTYSNLVHRRKMVEERLKQGRFRPVPHNISTASLESKLIWKLLGNEPPIHIRRTLDQFGYPNLRSTVARDDDQMLWKRTKKKVNLSEFNSALLVEDNSGNTGPFMDGKVLMVDQLWLWIVDERTVVTFFPHQEATTAEGKLYEQSNLYNSIYNELNGDLARRFETAGDLAALIVLHAATVLLDRTLHRDLQILRIFEESISILTESMTKSFKRFRNRGFITRPADFNKNADGKPMSAAEREERDHELASRNREDLSTLLELRDIIDELGTILKLLDVQTTIIKTMSSYFEHKGYGKVFMETSLSRLDDYRNQVLEMRENASLAQKAVENLLDLKQKQANVDESRLARWEAEVTQDQSRSVMVFTIFTIMSVFIPSV